MLNKTEINAHEGEKQPIKFKCNKKMQMKSMLNN